MGKLRIDHILLDRMLREGATAKECAEYFSVSQSAVCQARKKLKVAVVKDVVLRSAHRVLDKNLNTIDQLHRVNEEAFCLLEMLKSWIDGDPKVLDKIKKTHSFKGFQYKGPEELFLKTISEIRSQLQFQKDIFQTLYDLQGAAAFQEEVLSAVAEEAPHVRKKILQKLQQRHALQQSIAQP